MKILIAGLAKTGTTGLHYLIANSMGEEEKPKLLFEPKVCPNDLVGNVIAKVLIGPQLDAKTFSHFDKKITIVRDPRDRIVSSLLYSQYHANYLADAEKVRTVRECLEKKEANPGSISIHEILQVLGRVSGHQNMAGNFQVRIRKSLDWFDDFVKAMPDGMLYKYEDFVSAKYESIAKLLEMEITGAAEVPEKLSRVNRTKGYGDWRNWFTTDDVKELRPLLSSWLEKYGYDADDWQLNAAQVISQEHCSKYFMRLVEEQKSKAAATTAGKRVGGKSSAKNSGRIMRIEEGRIVGWAIGADFDKPVSLTLRINGKEVAKSLANKPRPGLKEQGLHPTGNCGFIFRLPTEHQLKIGDQVAVSPEGEEFLLRNSPSTLEAPTAG